MKNPPKWHPTMNVRELNAIEELGPLRQAWHTLLGQTPEASFFQSLEWLEIYWRHFGANKKLRVLVVNDGAEPIGFLPLVVTREDTRVGTVRVLTYPLHDWGDSYGPIGPRPGVVLAAGLDHVRRTRRDWDVVELRWLAGQDHAEIAQKAFQMAGLQCYRTTWYETAVIDVAGTWEQYLAAHTSKWRNNLRRWERRINQLGQIRYLRFRPGPSAAGDDDPRWDLYETCEEIARRSWQGSSQTGTTLSHASVRPFLRDAHQAAARLGAVDLNLLYLDDRPLAFAYNYHWQGRLFGLRVGYDAEQAQDGAGNYLYSSAIRDSFARGDRLYDLGPGSLEIKRYFLTRLHPIWRVSHFAWGSPRAQLLRLKRWTQARRPLLDVQGPGVDSPLAPA